MNRFILVIFPLTAILALLFSSASSAQDTKSTSCIQCHEDVYKKVFSYKYQHSVVIDKCPLCHIKPAEDEDAVISYLQFPGLQRECLIYLDRLSENRDYKAEVTVTDSYGKSGDPVRMDIAPENAWEPDSERSSFKLKKLSGVTVNEIKRRGFVRAVISWDTDVYATSEIEYRSTGDRPGTSNIKGLYTKDHKIILDGLKHRNRYNFRAVSRDVYGNTLKSEEYNFDTSEEFSRPELKGEDLTQPSIQQMQMFRSAGNEGLFLKVSANKPCEISVRIKEVKKRDEKHGSGLLPARYSRIEVCYKCHPHDSSHPVGVKAESPKIRTPEELPTIEDGIITCVTCHTPHGGDRPFYNRFDFRKDLCMRCHLQKYDNM